MTERLIGRIDVDSGMCWIGDPCYILHKDKDSKYSYEQPPKEIGENWNEFCDLVGDMDSYPWAKSFEHSKGNEGLGVCVTTGCGDGFYPVYVTYNSEGRIVGVRVDFYPN